MTTCTIPDAIDHIAGLFIAAGVVAATARSVATALVAAEADGLKGHGLSRVPSYLAMVKSGKIDGRALPVATRPKPGVLAIDARDGFAYAAIDLALAELPAIARAQGVALAYELGAMEPGPVRDEAYFVDGCCSRLTDQLPHHKGDASS